MTPAPKPPFRPPNVEKSPEPGGKLGLLATIGVILLLIYGLSRCSADSGNTASDAYNATNANMSNAIAAQAPPAPEPLNAASVSRGIAHLRLAVTAEGFPGAMIYSQNCYAALGREFSWAKLDQCGGFDMLAVRSIASADTTALTSEPAWFQSEAAAGRYLAAATGAGEPASEADQRLSQLQARAAQVRLVGQRPPPAPTNEGLDPDDGVDDSTNTGNDLEAAWLDRAISRTHVG